MAEVINWLANLTSSKVPPGRALSTNSVCECFASLILGVGKVGNNAFTIDHFPSLVASFTNSHFPIEVFAFGLDFTTDSLVVEVVVFRTLHTNSFIPSLASEIVIKERNEGRVVEVILGEDRGWLRECGCEQAGQQDH